MRIIGTGFLARHLAVIAHRHDGVVALAAGVSAAATTSTAGFDREAELLYRIARECAASGERLMFFSTAAAGMYSAVGDAGREDGPVFPGTPYGRHKLALEAVLRSTSVDHLILRLSHVVGAHQPPHQLLPSLVEQVCSGRVRLFRGARRDLIDVADMVEIVDALLTRGVRREVVNVASGRAVPVADIIGHLEHRLGVVPEHEVVAATCGQAISVAKLARLVPAVGPRFGDDYFRTVLDRYAEHYAVGRPSAPSSAR